jgi:hypothetical protein
MLEGAGPAGQSLLALVEREHGESDEALWLAVQVDEVSDVLDLYLLATMLGARASLPRRRGGRWTTVVLDPDGNRLSIWTAVPSGAPRGGEGAEGNEGFSRTRAARSPRWAWESRERAPLRHGRARETETAARPADGREANAALSWAGRTEESGRRA